MSFRQHVKQTIRKINPFKRFPKPLEIFTHPLKALIKPLKCLEEPLTSRSSAVSFFCLTEKRQCTFSWRRSHFVERR